MLSTSLTDKDEQNLTFSNDTLYIQNGNAVVLTDLRNDEDVDPFNELQTLSISNDTIYLSEGGQVILPSDTLNMIQDADGDTKVHVEENSDEDKIRFDVDGAEAMIIEQNNIKEIYL